MPSVKSWIVIFEREYYNVRVFGNDPAGDLRPRYQMCECIPDVEKDVGVWLTDLIRSWLLPENGCWQKYRIFRNRIEIFETFETPHYFCSENSFFSDGLLSAPKPLGIGVLTHKHRFEGYR
ncbi:hypothetical protein GCM10007084_12470 [Parabacteroides faecis]|nr:hypothetical protein GCM10007084_12470 [Parabacteroides faecis]